MVAGDWWDFVPDLGASSEIAGVLWPSFGLFFFFFFMAIKTMNCARKLCQGPGTQALT